MKYQFLERQRVRQPDSMSAASEDVYMVSTWPDIAIIIESMRKQGTLDSIESLLEEIHRLEQRGDIEILELDRSVLVRGMFEWRSDWGLAWETDWNPEYTGEFWHHAIRRDLRPEENGLLTVLRDHDLQFKTDLVDQAIEIYDIE